MKTLQIEVPEAFLETVGSEEEAKKILIQVAVAQLVKSKHISVDEATRMSGIETLSSQEWMQLIEDSGAFDFWNEPGEDIYTEEDGEPI